MTLGPVRHARECGMAAYMLLHRMPKWYGAWMGNMTGREFAACSNWRAYTRRRMLYLSSVIILTPASASALQWYRICRMNTLGPRHSVMSFLYVLRSSSLFISRDVFKESLMRNERPINFECTDGTDESYQPPSHSLSH